MFLLKDGNKKIKQKGVCAHIQLTKSSTISEWLEKVISLNSMCSMPSTWWVLPSFQITKVDVLKKFSF